MKLVEATEAQKLVRDRLTYAEWGKTLSVDEYCEREEQLRSHRWAKRAMQTWLLLEGDQVLASCETFRMVSLIDGGDRGHSYGVASVFTEAALRGNRFASTLLLAVGEELTIQDKKLHASLLFSDVGAPIYERIGYEPRPGMDRILPPLDRGFDERLIPITDERAASEWEATPAPALPYLVWPTADQLDWHLERERIYARMLNRNRPSSCGARVGHSTIFWCTYFASDTLAVLLLNAYSTEEARMLLHEAQRAAFIAGVSKVQLWESAAVGPWREALADTPPRAREGSLPMLRAFVPKSLAAEWSVIPRAVWI